MSRAKFTVVSKSNDFAGAEAVNVLLSAVVDGSEENKQFFKWTPSGQITLSTVNPVAAAEFVQGKSYYVDFTPAEE